MSLLAALKTEFCPPLDSSLLAAFLADIEWAPDGKPLLPSSARIQSLRAILRELADLAAEAVEQQLSDELVDVHLSDTDSTPELYTGDTVSSDSNYSGSSQYLFSSPLGFLQTALPHIPISKLREALDDAGGDTDGVDIEL
jgi:hypothetical protein